MAKGGYSLKKALKFGLICLVWIALAINLGLSFTLKTDKEVYYCDPFDWCEPVKLTLTNDIIGTYKIVFTWSNETKGYIYDNKLPYAFINKSGELTVSNLAIQKGTYNFIWTAKVRGTVKFNVTIYSGSNKVVAQLDPFFTPDCTQGRRINITNSWNNAPLYNFTAPVFLNSSVLNYSATNETDLRFYSSNGSLLNKDVELWNITGTSIAWVKIPNVNITDDFLYMYYSCNTSVSDNISEIWSDYEVVYHLNNTLTDVSPNGNTGVVTGNTNFWDNGTLAGSFYFDGASVILSTSNIGVSNDDTRTYSVWAKLYTWADSTPYIGQGSVYDNGDWLVGGFDGNYYYGVRGNGVDATYTSTDSRDDFGIWTLLTYVYDGNNRKIYRNGTIIGDEAKAVSSTDTPLALGRLTDYPAGYLIAQEDEARVTKLVRDIMFINASYLAETNQFFIFGDLETFEPEPEPPLVYGNLTCPDPDYSQPTMTLCLDNNTLYQEFNFTYMVNNIYTNCSQMRTVLCSNGCSFGKCNKLTYESYLDLLYIFIALLGAFIMILIISKMRIR